MNGTPYIVAAYAVVMAVFGTWVAIMLRRVSRRARELARLDER